MWKTYVTIKEASEILDVSPITLRRWDKKRSLKASRHPFNNYRLYKLKDIKKLADKIKKSKI